MPAGVSSCCGVMATCVYTDAPRSRYAHFLSAKNAKQLLATIDYHSQSSLVTGSGTFPVREELRQMGLVFQRNENGLHPRWCGAPLSPQQEARLCAAAREHGIWCVCFCAAMHHARLTLAPYGQASRLRSTMRTTRER